MRLKKMTAVALAAALAAGSFGGTTAFAADTTTTNDITLSTTVQNCFPSRQERRRLNQQRIHSAMWVHCR